MASIAGSRQAGSLGEWQVEKDGLAEPAVVLGGGGANTGRRSTTKMAGQTGGAAFHPKVVFAPCITIDNCYASSQLIIARLPHN